MTSNQIEYWKLEELKRANLINEEQARQIAAETRRHNLATEQNDYQRIEVQRQGNLLQLAANNEIARSNKAKEQISYSDQILRQYLGQLQAQTSTYGADIQRANALTSANASKYSANMNYAAQKYSSDKSLTGTKYTADTNKAVAKANRDQDMFKFLQSYGQTASQNAETKRHNAAMEGINQAQTAGGLINDLLNFGLRAAGLFSTKKKQQLVK